MKEKVERPVVLTTKQLEYLERMRAAYDLPDVSKAIRVLVSHAMACPDEERAIFETIRCAQPDRCDGEKPA